MAKKQQDYQKTKRKIALDFFEGKCGGIFNGKECNFVLKQWEENLWDNIRNEALIHFEGKWHRYAKLGHILSSQICCINHLFPIRKDKENVLRLAQVVCDKFTDVLPIDTDNDSPVFIKFEATCPKSYLNEKSQTSGNNCTSIDALICAKHENKNNYLIPIEWKYTEPVDYNDYSKGKQGKARLKSYEKSYKELNESKNESNLKYLNFFGSFYQLMRQTLWAEQMIHHKNDESIKAEDYIHVHIIPKEHTKFLENSKKPLEKTWKDNLKDKEKYVIISPVDFIKNIDNNKYKNLLIYLKERYWPDLLIKSSS